MRIFIKGLLLLLIPVIFKPVLAQEKESKLEKIIIDKLSFQYKGWNNLIIPIAGYEPLTRIALGIGVLSTKKIGKDTSAPMSFSEFDMLYTQNGQFLLEEEVFLYIGKKYIIKGLAGYAMFPDKFWGIGNDQPGSLLQHYNNNRYYANVHFLRNIYSKWYVGVKYRLFGIYNIVPDENDPHTLSGVKGENGGISSGLGYSVVWDSRDNVLNSFKGSYFNIAHTFFDKYAGSDFSYSRIEVDARKYLNTFKKQVLALQITGLFNSGTPPFSMMALLGSDSEMRGYYKGRYRDRNYFSTQAEYRMPLFWRIGVVGFAGVGEVAHQVSDFNFSGLKYSLGGGLRFKVNVKQNINLRVDYAVGQQSDGLYIYLGEAF